MSSSQALYSAVYSRERREQFDDRTQRTFVAEDRAAVRFLARTAKTICVIAIDQIGDPIEIFFEISDENRALKNGVGDGFGDFRFAAARNRAGFMAKRAFRHGADQPPARPAVRFFHVNFVAGRAHISLAGEQFDAVVCAIDAASSPLLVQIEMDIFRHVDDVREVFIDGVAFGLHVHDVAVEMKSFPRNVCSRRRDVQIPAEFFAQIVAWKNQRAARVFFFAQAEEIRGIADLRFDLFFAIAEIVVGDDGDDHAAFVAARKLESVAVVVEFGFRISSTCQSRRWRSVALIPVRQAQRLFSSRRLNAARE